jgi:hypothetical protein
LKSLFRARSFFLKGISSKTISFVNIPIPYLYFKPKSWGITDFIFGVSRVIDLAETKFDDFRSDYLGEYEAIFGTVSACLSGTYMVFIDEKPEGRKSRATVPLMSNLSVIMLDEAK